MSIIDTIKEVTEKEEQTVVNVSEYRKFLMAGDIFEQLVQEGIIARRGYQLETIENSVHNDLKVNRSIEM